MGNRFFLISWVLLLAVGSYGQTAKYSNEFLAIGVGARGLGMSGAVSASVAGAEAAYWNPAGLSLMKNERELALMHSEYFAGIAKYDYGTFAARIDNTSVASISMIRFGVDDIPDTSELIDSEGNINYDKVKSFSAADYAFIFSYGRAAEEIDGLQYGGNVKIVRRKAGDFASSWGFGADIGMRYETGEWIFGAMGRDITTTFNAWSYNLTDQMKEVFTITGNEIPVSSVEITTPRIILATARNFRFNPRLNLLAEINLDVTTDGKRNVPVKTKLFSIDPHMGLELNYNKFVFLRAGVGNIQQHKAISGGKETTFQPNVGIGLNIKERLFIDYAFTDPGNNSLALYSHVFSLRLMFNKMKKNDS
ncbi:MAG: PorV/PorQ family protein [Bacteroidales bacterium]